MSEKINHFQVSFTTRGGKQQEGPLGLLWTLIENYDVDIFEVSLTQITNDFINYIENTAVGIDEESEFVLMASRLINYKSKLLLPNPGFEDESDPDSLPLELVEQLLEYKKFQLAAERLREIETKSHLSYNRDSTWNHYEEGLDYLHVDLLGFLKAFHDFLVNMDQKGVMEVETEEVDIETMVAEIKYFLRNNEFLLLFQWLKNSSIIRIIVAFLAILELIRIKAIRVYQQGQYQEIKIFPTESLFKIENNINGEND